MDNRLRVRTEGRRLPAAPHERFAPSSDDGRNGGPGYGYEPFPLEIDELAVPVAVDPAAEPRGCCVNPNQGETCTRVSEAIPAGARKTQPRPPIEAALVAGTTLASGHDPAGA